MERYELGKRLRRFEQSWQSATDEQRKPTATIMQDAVRSFFSLQLLGAAQKLDEAYFTVNDQSSSGWMQAVAAFRLKLTKQLFDENADAVSVSIERFYKTNFALAPDLSIVWEIRDQSGTSILQHDSTWAESLEGVDLNIKALTSGDYWLRCTVKREDQTFAFPETLFSKVDQLESKLMKLDQVLQLVESQLDSTVRATINDHLALLKSIQDGKNPESDFPAFRVIGSDLKLASSNDQDSVTHLISQFASQADQWITLTRGKRKVPVRLRAPQNGSANKLPVLFLFHGAGGSENMFFETYGAGQAVTEGLNRGWLVVAPRQSLIGLGLNCKEMLDELERFFDIDRNQVYLIGHSMGAGQVIRQATLQPDLPTAAAVIGGGNAPRDAGLLSKISWYVAAGSLDFGKSGAAGFYQSLKKSNVPNAKYEEFADIEHMVIVQAALPSVFKFFDDLQPTGRNQP